MFRKLCSAVTLFPQFLRAEQSAISAPLVSLCRCNNGRPMDSRYFHASALRLDKSRKEKRIKVPLDEGTEGEARVGIDPARAKKGDPFPTEETYDQLFNGIPFKNVPVCSIRVSKNNTIFALCQMDGTGQLIRSCGIEGFKNARKGTNIAAQATAITFSQKALEQGYKTIRVAIRGLGPGRAASIKGLVMGGMDIISVTDTTRISWSPPRPRKPRRL